MAQQTAVGWLIMQLPVKIRVELYEKNIHEQALQMEKEQIIEAFDTGCQDEDRIGIEYYNETYERKS